MNRYSHCRKLISPSKFQRIYKDNLDSVGCAMIWRGHDSGWTNSLSAVKVGNFIYATFACNQQKGNRLETYSIKYNLESPLDFISFQPFPRHVQKVEF